jgi:hypothetical protein
MDEHSETPAWAAGDTEDPLTAEYGIEIARGAGLTAAQLATLGDMLRRHATTTDLRRLRVLVLDLLERYAAADQAAAPDADNDLRSEGSGD